jgi:group I intron endonuclease
MAHIIYRATCSVSGKAYIGLTKRTLAKRRQFHYYDSKAKNNCHFHAALRKYRETDWNWEVLFYCEQREVESYERKTIALYDTYKNGYNSTTGGGQGKKISEQTKAKMSAAKKGVPKSKEHKTNISVAKKNCEFTEEHRANISKSLKKYVFTEEHKANLRLGAKRRLAKIRLANN